MTRKWAKSLLRLYPSDWRDRYREEFEALLEQRSLSFWDGVDVVRGALGARLHALISPRSSSLPPPVAVLLWWLALGVLLGAGFVAVPSLGPAPLLVGMLLIAGSALTLGPTGAWAAGIGLGLWPSLILVHTIRTAPPPCQPAGTVTASGACASIPPSYGIAAAIMALIPLVGLVAGVWIQGRGRHAPAPTSEVGS